CYDDNIHVPLFIRHPRLARKLIEPKFSMINIQRLILGLMENDEVDPTLLSSHIIVMREPVYNPLYRSNKEVRRNAGEWFDAYVMVRNDEYKLILFDSGLERLYKLPDEENNLALISDYQSIKDELLG